MVLLQTFKTQIEELENKLERNRLAGQALWDLNFLGRFWVQIEGDKEAWKALQKGMMELVSLVLPAATWESANSETDFGGTLACRAEYDALPPTDADHLLAFTPESLLPPYFDSLPFELGLTLLAVGSASTWRRIQEYDRRSQDGRSTGSVAHSHPFTSKGRTTESGVIKLVFARVFENEQARERDEMTTDSDYLQVIPYTVASLRYSMAC